MEGQGRRVLDRIIEIKRVGPRAYLCVDGNEVEIADYTMTTAASGNTELNIKIVFSGDNATLTMAASAGSLVSQNL